jgi:histidinol-phosphatase
MDQMKRAGNADVPRDARAATAVAAARAAGAVARGYFGSGVRVEWKEEGGSRSPVTIADREAEEAARAVIAARFPGHGFLGEESGETGSRAARWILDPIDGTANFIRGIPFFGALVALEEEGVITAAAMYNPIFDEMAWALRGGGAFRKGAPIRVSAIADLAQALVVHSSAGEFVRRGVGGAGGLNRLLRSVGRDRGFGDYYGYVLVAAGQAEAMLDAHAAPWDLAAPKLLVEEAGGRFTSLAGHDSIYERGAVATNGPLHAVVLERLASGSGD